MTKYDNQKIIEYCDSITKSGKTLSVTWDGGNDSGYFELLIDEEAIDNLNDIQQDIISFLDDEVGYGSFAGDFNTTGKLFYNSSEKCFEGTDTYTNTMETTKNCSIEIRVPKYLWFDSIQINLQMDSEDIKELTVKIHIRNGVRTPHHSQNEYNLQKMLVSKFGAEIESLLDLCGSWNIINIGYKEFAVQGADLVYTINNFEYNYYDTTESSITIHLNN